MMWIKKEIETNFGELVARIAIKCSFTVFYPLTLNNINGKYHLEQLLEAQ